jgi:hypothetical protein
MKRIVLIAIQWNDLSDEEVTNLGVLIKKRVAFEVGYHDQDVEKHQSVNPSAGLVSFAQNLVRTLKHHRPLAKGRRGDPTH